MDHLETGMIESAQASPTDFEKWVANAERILGHGLDGTECVDGYSVDGALEAYRAGATSAEYAARVRSARNRLEYKDDSAQDDAYPACMPWGPAHYQ